MIQNFVDTHFLSKFRNSTIATITLALATAIASESIEISCLTFIIPNLHESLRPSKFEIQLVSAASFFGMLMGGLIIGFLSDRIGRKPSLLGTLLLNSVSGLVSAVSPNMSTLILSRMVGGYAIGGSVPICFSIGTELLPSNRRGQCLSIIASFWMVGSVFASSFAWILLGYSNNQRIIKQANWRSLALICAFPSALAFVLIQRYVSESPNYLLHKNRFQDTISAIETTYNLEILNKQEIFDKFVGMKRSIMEPEYAGIQAVFSNFFSVPETIPLMIVWFTLSFVSFGMITWIYKIFLQIGVYNPYSACLMFALSGLPGNILSMLIVDKLGGKITLVYGMIGSALSTGILLLTVDMSLIAIACACLFNTTSTIAWNSLDWVSPESFNTSNRVFAVSILSAAGRIGAIVAQFAYSDLVKMVSILMAVNVVVLLIACLMCYLITNRGQAFLREIFSVNRSEANEYATVSTVQLSLHGLELPTIDESEKRDENI